MPSIPRLAYDVFLSHNRADKPWVRDLARWLADQEYNGRHLRPWLDEHFLDPGSLASDAELTTALDRSRVLGLVLSPEALASTWVEFEIRHFLRSRGAAALLPLLLRDCPLPDTLPAAGAIDFRGRPDDPAGRARLLDRLTPPPPVTPEEVRREVGHAFAGALDADPGGFSPGPTPQRDDLLAALLRADIDDPATEGPAVAGFLEAADRLEALCSARHPSAYDLKMLLGECLAAGLARSAGYRQVAQRFLDLAAASTDEPTLLFVVARSASKLAELDPARVDTSVLFRTAAQLDERRPTNEVRAIEALLARVLAKLREHPRGELLIKALTGRGRASRVIAAGAIALSYERSSPVFYLTSLEDAHGAAGEAARLPSGPPSRRLLGELFALDLDQEDSVTRAVRLARQDVEAAWPGIDFPYGLSWFLRREEIEGGHRLPFAGTVLRVGVAGMEAAAGGVGPATVACLAEPRVVDALFDGAGALLLPAQEEDSPQCRRLRERGMPFALLGAQTLANLRDGDHVVVEAEGMRILRG